jgi:hypothetical protein
MALHIPELVATIVEFAVEDASISSAAAERNARALMLTSKIFSHFALNFIWKKINSLVTLLSVITPDIWVERTEDNPVVPPGYDNQTVLAFSRCLNADEWERLDFYAKRIKRLQLELTYSKWSLRGTPVSSSALEYLFKDGRLVSILPNLHELEILLRDSNPRSGCVAPWLIQPSLKSIKLEMKPLQDENKTANLMPFFQAVFSICRKLKKLQIIDDKHGLEFWQGEYQVLDTIRKNKLIEFAINSRVSDCSVLNRLGFDSHITKLTIQLANGAMDTYRFPSSQMFPSLKCLVLEGNSWIKAQSFLAVVHKARLMGLSTRIKSPLGTALYMELASFIATASDSLDVAAVSEIEIFNLTPITEQQIPPCSAEHSLLRPFLRFVNMSYFKVSLSTVFDENCNEFTEEMAKAWPRLEQLMICGVKGYQPKFSSLVNLSRQCPSLWRIQVQPRDDFVPDWYEENDKRVASLTHLSVFHATIRDPKAAALSLVKAFPLLNPGRITSSTMSMFSWDVVKDYMTLYREGQGNW